MSCNLKGGGADHNRIRRRAQQTHNELIRFVRAADLLAFRLPGHVERDHAIQRRNKIRNHIRTSRRSAWKTKLAIVNSAQLLRQSERSKTSLRNQRLYTLHRPSLAQMCGNSVGIKVPPQIASRRTRATRQTSAMGAAQLSPAGECWIRGPQKEERRRRDTNILSVQSAQCRRKENAAPVEKWATSAAFV